MCYHERERAGQQLTLLQCVGGVCICGGCQPSRHAGAWVAAALSMRMQASMLRSRWAGNVRAYQAALFVGEWTSHAMGACEMLAKRRV